MAEAAGIICRTNAQRAHCDRNYACSQPALEQMSMSDDACANILDLVLRMLGEEAEHVGLYRLREQGMRPVSSSHLTKCRLRDCRRHQLPAIAQGLHAYRIGSVSQRHPESGEPCLPFP